MRGGQLRHIVDIEYKAVGADDGYGNLRDVWTVLYANVPAMVKAAGANETWVGDEIQSQGAFQINTRYLDGINSSMRFKFKGRTFNILSISNMLERNIELMFQCKEVIPTPDSINLKTLSGKAHVNARHLMSLNGKAEIVS
jgi:SPP1 family predicted phage head-tail adaptor